MSDVDYQAIEIPPDVPLTELEPDQRRADLLQRVLDAGGPSLINQSAVAEEYGVHRSTISRDMDELAEYVAESIGDDAKLTARAIFETVLADLEEADDWRASKAAFDIVMEWQAWLQDTGEQHREPEQIDVTADSYRVIHQEADLDVLEDTADAASEDVIDERDVGFSLPPE